MKIKADYSNQPLWKEVNVKSSLPKELASLDELAHNMWWAWNYEARNMWKSLDKDLYEEVGHNPVLLLERLSYERKQAIVKDKVIMKKVKDVYKKFRDYWTRSLTASAPRWHTSLWSMVSIRCSRSTRAVWECWPVTI